MVNYFSQKKESVWKDYSKQMKISGLKEFDTRNIHQILSGDFWKKGIIVAESGFKEIGETISNNEPLIVSVGYQPGRVHLGYYVMSDALSALGQYNKTDFFSSINISESMRRDSKSLEEVLNMNKSTEDILFRKMKEPKIRIYDIPSLNKDSLGDEYRNLFQNISESLSVDNFSKIFGWKTQVPLANYNDIISSITGILYPSIKECSSISFTDIKHLPFVRISKYVAKKLKLKEPSFLLMDSLPSINNPHQRMSSSGGKNTIYLDSSNEFNKLLKAKSGKGDVKNINDCHALKIASFIIPSEESEKIEKECSSKAYTSCKNCKEDMINKLKNIKR